MSNLKKLLFVSVVTLFLQSCGPFIGTVGMVSLGAASKATGNFKSQKPIIKTDPMVERFQKLAGLK